MTVKAIRLQNFMAFGELAADAAWDERWVELRPITLLFGRNSSGKSTIIRALRLLQQSLQTSIEGEENERNDPFIYTLQDGVDVDSFLNMAHGGNDKLYTYQDGERETDPDDIRQIETAWSEHQGSTKRLIQFEFLIELSREETRDFWSDEESVALETDTFLLSLGYGWFDPLKQAGLVSFSISKLFRFESTTTMITLFAADLLPNPTSVQMGEWYFVTDWLETHLIPTFTNSWAFLKVVTAPSFLPYFAVDQSDLSEGIWIDEEGTRKLIETGEDFQSVARLLRLLRVQITQFLQSIIHIPPMRPAPEPYYLLDEAEQARWHRRGLGAYLDAMKAGIAVDSPLGTEIARWLQTLDLGIAFESKIDTVRRGAAFHLEITEQNGLVINLADVGYGASQVIPIIVQCLSAPPNALVIIEQPELHLHPRAQANLTNLFVETIRHKIGTRFLIETHSEHTLLRLRRWAAEKTSGKRKLSNDIVFIDFHDLAAFFIHRYFEAGYSRLTQIKFSQYGEFENTPEGFEDFFSDDILESLALTDLRFDYDSDSDWSLEDGS